MELPDLTDLRILVTKTRMAINAPSMQDCIIPLVQETIEYCLRNSGILFNQLVE